MTRDGARRLRWRTPLAVLLVAALLADCSKPDPSPVSSTLPTLDVSSRPDRSLPPATGTWTGLNAKCPKLESAAARALGVTGEGRPTPYYHGNYSIENGLSVNADCRWGVDDGSGTAVRLEMSISPSQQAADAGWQVLSAGRTDHLPGVGDEAFSALEPFMEPPAVAVRVRSKNAVATVRIGVPYTANRDREAIMDRLRDVQPLTAEITNDVLDDLR